MLRRTLLALVTLTGFALALPATAQQGTPQMPSPSKSGFVPVTGGKVWYAAYGAGAPLVLLHGGLMTNDGWGPTLPALAANHTVIAIELQGHGHTGPIDRPMTFAAMANDVAAVIAALGYDKADIMGYSMGGDTALRFALDFPERVNRLVLVSTPFAFAGWHDYNQQGMRAMNEGMAEGMKQTPLYQMFAAVNPDPEANWPKLIGQMGRYMGQDYDWSSEIGNLKMPVQLIYADWDAVRTSHAAKFFELLGGGLQDAQWDKSGMNHNRLAIIPGETHYTIGTSPRLAETVLGFIDQQ